MDRESFHRVRSWGGTAYIQFLTERWDYDSEGKTLYHGIAPAGSADTDSNWIVYKYNYDSGNRLSYVQVCSFNHPTAYGVKWTERATVVTYRT